MSGEKLARAVDHPQARYLERDSFDDLAQFLQPGDVLVTLGAGDISKLGERFAESFAKRP